MRETKHERFKRLAKLRGNRILKDISLLENLANKNNYDYTGEDVRKLFTPIEKQLRETRIRFGYSQKKNDIDL